MNPNIKVTIVRYRDRRSYLMRYRDPGTGKLVSKSAKTTERRVALRKAAQWEAQLIQSGHLPAKKTTWPTFRARYERDVFPGLAVKTQQLIDVVFDLIERQLRPKLLADLNQEQLSNLLQFLRAGKRSDSTVRTYFAHLRAALKWAVKTGLLAHVADVTVSQRGAKKSGMKGRPITELEFRRLLEAAEEVVGPFASNFWRRFLTVLWLSGLRLAEVLNLSWDEFEGVYLVAEGEDFFLRIDSDFEKGNRDRLLPLSPEFCDFLSNVPYPERTGKVAPLVDRHGKPRDFTAEWASRTIARIGVAANVIVQKNPTSGRIKYASAHDLRRSFAERWARRVMPVVLKELMRHESIETTLKYYVGVNAKETARVLREASVKG